MRGLDGVSLAEAALAERKRCDWSCLSLPNPIGYEWSECRRSRPTLPTFALIWIKATPLESVNISKILNA
jgi:hypothetical protein